MATPHEELYFYLINEGRAIARNVYLFGELHFYNEVLGPTEILSGHGGIRTVMSMNNGRLCFQSVLNEGIQCRKKDGHKLDLEFSNFA